MRIIEPPHIDLPPEDSLRIVIAADAGGVTDRFSNLLQHERRYWHESGILIKDPNEPKPFDSLEGYAQAKIREDLSRFASTELPASSDVEVYVLSNEWSELHVLLVSEEVVASYLWGTGG